MLAATLASRFLAVAGVALPYTIASASVPIVALAPLAIVWFGIGPGSKIAIAALMTFFPTFVGTVRGLLGVETRSLELMRSLRRDRVAGLLEAQAPATACPTCSPRSGPAPRWP